MQQPVRIRTLNAGDIGTMRDMLAMFGVAFEDIDTYTRRQPDDAYLQALLSNPAFIAIVAESADEVVGGLAAYVLPKFEQARSEVYIYDLAVDARCRRRGIATTMIREVQKVGRAQGAHVVFVQADHVDAPAVALYTKLGVREDVLHFDIGEPDDAA